MLLSIIPRILLALLYAATQFADTFKSLRHQYTKVTFFCSTFQDLVVHHILESLVRLTNMKNLTLCCIKLHLPFFRPVNQLREIILK